MRRVLLASFFAIGALQAQSPELTGWEKAAGGKMAFDVASIKPTKSPRLPNFPLNNGDAKPPGGYMSASFSLPAYIGFAYKLDAFQWKEMNAQLPKWAGEDYALDAKADGNPTKDQMRLMMQSLLADRFKLRVHFETREVPVFALTLVKPGKVGPKLRPHSEGPPCPDSFEMDKPFTPLSPPTKAGVVFPTQCGTSAQILGVSEGTWIGSRNTTMELLASDIYGLGSLSGEVDKPVVDRTELKGGFDFILELPAGTISLFPKPPNPDDPQPDPKGTPLLNALSKQLGLKLVPDKRPVRVLVVDHVEKPTEN
jgi:bla regulator protein blaR1